MAINLYNPDQQIDFAVALIQMRDTYLQSALFAVVKDISIKKIDEELIQYVPSDDLSLLASKGLRGEVAFAVPSILTQNPYLIGYYRLLNGYSQKAFYSGETGLSFF